MRISEGAEKAGVYITGAPIKFRVKDVFTTHKGSWDRGHIYSPPMWADLDYPPSLREGGDHHIYVRLVDGYRENVTFETSGLHEVRQVEGDGWANLPIFNSYPAADPPAWIHFLEEKGQVLVGGGLPDGEHVSLFVVWENVNTVPEPVPGDDETHDIAITGFGQTVRISANGYAFEIEVVP